MTWKELDSEEKMLKLLQGAFVFLLVCAVIGLAIALYNSLFISPISDDKANQYCQEEGYDFYESYSRIGIFSKEPMAIRCKFVEQYRKIDISRRDE